MNPTLAKIEGFIGDYVTFEDTQMPFLLALWVSLTHVADIFDAFPYGVVTSYTKRSGKTRCAEIMSMFACNPYNSAGITPAALFAIINLSDEAGKDDGERAKLPTIFFDEAELLSSESANTMRALLNVGYRKGQTIPRVAKGGGGVTLYKTFCPKVFILIGDVYDTLKDRSIIITMRRSEPRKRFSLDAASCESAILKENLRAEIDVHRQGIKEFYDKESARFLSDRDEEIWRPILAGCRLLAPERIEDLQRFAVDMCSAKTTEKRRYSTLDMFETNAENDEYAEKLLRDCHAILKGFPQATKISSMELLAWLKQMPLAPWRKFKGDGLGASNMADLLSRFGLRPRNLRIGGKQVKAYSVDSIHRAFKLLDAPKG